MILFEYISIVVNNCSDIDLNVWMGLVTFSSSFNFKFCKLYFRILFVIAS